jgi:uncharacterized protein with HEPN domain
VSPRDWRLRVEDILQAIDRALKFTEGMDAAAFKADDKTVQAVTYCFVIIGEATRQLPEELTSAHPEVPWADMRAMRNIAVHEYFGVTLDTLFATARGDLPELAQSLRKLLSTTG